MGACAICGPASPQGTLLTTSPSSGECSTMQREVIETLHPKSIIGCQFRFKHDIFSFPAGDIFAVEPGFDTALGKPAGI